MKRRKSLLKESSDLPPQILNNNDKSPIIPQRNKLKGELNIFQRELTEKQKVFVDLALSKESKLIFVSGPAGTAKTYLCVYAALCLINMKKVSDLIYVRSAVESADSKLGFLPGEVNDKMAPYVGPMIEKLEELLPKNQIDILSKENRISGMPVGFLRGKSWNAKVIIGDEAQNMTLKELLTLITRIGEFSKVFIMGDPDQSDINGKSGFKKMTNVFDDEESKQNGIHVFNFEEDDIVRSSLVRFIAKKMKNVI